VSNREDRSLLARRPHKGEVGRDRPFAAFLDPLKGQLLAFGDAFDHLQRQLRLGPKLQFLGDAATFALLGVLFAEPDFRQIQATIHEGVAVSSP